MIPARFRPILRPPARLARAVARRILAGSEPIKADESGVQPSRYEDLYEHHARSEGDDGVGSGDYDIVGEIEFDVLRAVGLESSSTLLDFGCGNGRLGVHVVPYLTSGTYIGTDIAPTFLAQAGRRLEPLRLASGCSVRLIHQRDESFDLPDHSIDVACAFSVFTHMEHEDMYRYLVQLKRVVRKTGTVVVSCLPMDLDAARHIFLTEAALNSTARWQRVRNVTTSVQMVDEIAALAGWSVDRWLPGTAGQAASVAGDLRSLGQSIVVLTPA